MAFGIGVNCQKTNAGPVRGKQQKIACECWFTSSGKITPLMIKLEDEEGGYQVIHSIIVHSQEKKIYAGTPSIEFDCTISLQGTNRRVWLIYYQDENRWVMNFR